MTFDVVIFGANNLNAEGKIITYCTLDAVEEAFTALRVDFLIKEEERKDSYVGFYKRGTTIGDEGYFYFWLIRKRKTGDSDNMLVPPPMPTDELDRELQEIIRNTVTHMG